MEEENELRKSEIGEAGAKRVVEPVGNDVAGNVESVLVGGQVEKQLG